LEDPYGEKILDFSYDDGWYPITDGHGFSLMIADVSLPWSVWGEKASWNVNGVAGGMPGGTDSELVLPGQVVINEVLAHTDPPQVDAIELRNAGGSPVNVGGWYLTDDFDVPRKYQIPAGTSIAAAGYLPFNESQFNAVPGAAGSFVLNSEGDDAWLFSADAAGNLTGYVDGFEFGATANVVSVGRHVNSVGTVDYPAEKTLTLGSQNAGPLVGPVVVSEIMYHPGSSASNAFGAYLELQNIAATNVPLFMQSEATNTWRIRDAVSFEFPQGVVLNPGARVLVVGFDPLTDAAALAQFMAAYQVPGSVPVFGPWQGGLDNSADAVELLKPDLWGTNGVPYLLVDKVSYRDSAPWPAEADGTGASLQRLGVSGYGNEPTNWVAGAPSAGSRTR
jgi:hypothetical protein